MNSYLIYRASFYLMLTVATMALSGDTVEKGAAQLYPMAVAIAGFVAFLTVDRHARLGDVAAGRQCHGCPDAGRIVFRVSAR